MKRIMLIVAALAGVGTIAQAQQRQPNPADMVRWNTGATEASVITRETASAGAILALPEGTNNGTNAVTFAAPASLAAARTITVPDADVTLANIAVSVGKINDLIAYLADGLLVVGDLAIDGVNAEKFGVDAISAYTIGGLAYTKAITDQLTFTGTETVNNGEAAEVLFGIWLVQINAAGVISTKAAAADMTYATDADAIAALPAPDAAHVALGYILVESPVSTKFTAGTTALTTIGSFVDGDVKSLPTAIP